MTIWTPRLGLTLGLLLALGATNGCGTDTGGGGSSDTAGAADTGGATDGSGGDGTASDGTAGDDTASADTTTGGETGTAEDTSADDSTAADSATPDDSTAGDSSADDSAATDIDVGEDTSGQDTSGQDSEGDGGGVIAPGCCNVDGDCTSGSICFFGPWNAGKCMDTVSLPAGSCWSDAQCAKGQTCEGGMACGCNALCKALDKPGTCKGGTGPTLCVLNSDGSSDCPSGAFCEVEITSGCQGKGSCTELPTLCTKELNPVCGCDGKTYDNPCLAAKAGVNQLSKGACEINKCLTVKCGDGDPCTTDTCDPKTGTCSYTPQAGNACDDGDACTNGDSCQAVDGKITCTPGKPTICNPSNSCETASCNHSTGQCESAPIPDCTTDKKCSLGLGAPTIDCGFDSFCQLPDGSGCTGFGLCAKKPQICPMVYAPVCGCDGKTYGNSCEANGGGTNIESKGACGSGGGGTGADGSCCKSDVDCKSGVCANQICKDASTLPAGSCWSDAQCPGGGCSGAQICPCGAFCFAPDKPGTCKSF